MRKIPDSLWRFVEEGTCVQNDNSIFIDMYYSQFPDAGTSGAPLKPTTCGAPAIVAKLHIFPDGLMFRHLLCSNHAHKEAIEEAKEVLSLESDLAFAEAIGKLVDFLRKHP